MRSQVSAPKSGNYAGVTVERKEGRLQGVPGMDVRHPRFAGDLQSQSAIS